MTDRKRSNPELEALRERNSSLSGAIPRTSASLDLDTVLREVIKKLRRKLGDDPAEPAWIFNVRGVGYRMPRPGEG